MSRDQDIDGGTPVLKRADPSTIQHKFLVGYQGWFTCPGDGIPLNDHGWSHWLSRPISAGGRPTTDIWPDISDYPPSELYPVSGCSHKSGKQTFVFSSRHPKTVQRHFHWMAQHGIDGAFLHRFVGQCNPDSENSKILRWRDEIGDHVKTAAETEGRVFAIMYDVCGVPPGRVQKILEQDWLHLIRDKCVLDSPNYLRESGRPVLCLCGFGFRNSGHNPDTVRAITSYIRRITPGGAYIIAGVPTHWRTGGGDADANRKFLDVWLNEFDAISPWTVGRYRNEEEVDSFAKDFLEEDMRLLDSRTAVGCRTIDYIPVVLPGGSGYNMSDGRWSFNSIRRLGGRFLWRQVRNACSLGAKTIYGATWDEYDEGTALMPAIESRLSLPVSRHYPFMALDEDGYDVPADWYMRICGLTARILRGEFPLQNDFPFGTLNDYWSGHSRLLGTSAFNGHTSAGEQPPPPYSEGGTLATTTAASQLRNRHPALHSFSNQRITPAGARPLPAVPTRTRGSLSNAVAPNVKLSLDSTITIASSTANTRHWDGLSNKPLDSRYMDFTRPCARHADTQTLSSEEQLAESSYHADVQSRSGSLKVRPENSTPSSTRNLHEHMLSSCSEDPPSLTALARTVSVTKGDSQISAEQTARNLDSAMPSQVNLSSTP